MKAAATLRETYYVFLKPDPIYRRLEPDRSQEGAYRLHVYLNQKHDDLLARYFEAGSYKKCMSLAIVDAFSVELTVDQAEKLRSVKAVRLVEKDMEIQ